MSSSASPRRPRLYIVAGPNGSGKSTFARELLADFDPPLPFVNVDDIARELSPSNVSKAAVEAGRIALRRMNALFEAGASFAIETTLSGFVQISLQNAQICRAGAFSSHSFFCARRG